MQTTILFVTLMLLLPVSVSAQTVGATIRGVVTEKSGAPVAGVEITVVNEETGEKRQVLTGAEGEDALAVLQPGTYRLAGESDGVYNGDPKLNTFAINPPVDAIREFEILTSTYDASFGRSCGAQVNVALKSGTNQFHGTAYEFFRNAALDARNFFARAQDPDPK